MPQDVAQKLDEKDAREQVGNPFRSVDAEGTISVTDSIEVELISDSIEVSIGGGVPVADPNDLRQLPPPFLTLQESLRPTRNSETIAVSVRFAKADDSVKVVVVGYIVDDDQQLKRMSLQEGTATATDRFDADGFWSVDLVFPAAAASLYQVRLEAPAEAAKAFSWTF